MVRLQVNRLAVDFGGAIIGGLSQVRSSVTVWARRQLPPISSILDTPTTASGLRCKNLEVVRLIEGEVEIGR